MHKKTFSILAIGALIPGIKAQDCAAGSAKQVRGNWYCDAVKAITYAGFGSIGSYKKVTSMEGGSCSAETFDYSGPLAPLDGEVSWHFRGPLNLKQFAFYAPGSNLEKKNANPVSHQHRRLVHANFHKRHKVNLNNREQHNEQNRAVGDPVTATIDGKVVTWINEYDGGAAPSNVPSKQSPKDNHRYAPPPPPAPLAPPQPPSPGPNIGAGNWVRRSYYNAESQISTGLTFLNNMGGQGSGVFDTTLGMSLSYASSDAKSGSPDPQILANQMLDDGDELTIMTDTPCSEDGTCGATRPGTVAYHGFDGPAKLFLLEFSMPLTGSTGFNRDMPAAWILNAQIPRTVQYGREECSCWKSGCGEWDIFEVLDPGNLRCKSTLHGGVNSGGDSNFFERPTDETVKVAVWFDPVGFKGHIVVLPDLTEFGDGFSDEQVQALVEGVADGGDRSTFRLGE